MQQCLVYLALAAFATYCARFRSSARPPWAVALFLLCIAVPLLPAWQNVSHDYSQFQLRSAATELTWRSGQASGNSMTLAYVRPGKVVGGVLRTGGFSDESHRVVFEPTPKGQQLNDQILLYFGKSELLISKPMDPTPRRSPGTAVAGADSASGPIERNDSAEVSR